MKVRARALAAVAAAAAVIVGTAVIVPMAVASSTAKASKHCFGLWPGGGGSGGGWTRNGHQVGGAIRTRSGRSIYIGYAPGCYGHDEPDIAPVSGTAGTAQNITWTVVLPKNSSTRAVEAMGPTFWFGAAVADSNPNSLEGQAFEELQFYPNSQLVSNGCGSDGSFTVTHVVNVYTVCSPVWAVDQYDNEYAAFNGMLKNSAGTGPFIMHAGDTISVHYFKGAQSGTPFNITVKDVTAGTTSKTLVLTGGMDGPLAPLFSRNLTTNYLSWGAVEQAPLSLSWEIGHPNFYLYPNTPECLPGMFNCYSYNVSAGWLGISPLQIKSATFNNATVKPSSWAVVDGQGGSAEDALWCGSYNHAGSNGSCTFPWYTYNGSKSAVLFGGSYTGTTDSWNTYQQFATNATYYNPTFGDNLYPARTLSPNPPIP